MPQGTEKLNLVAATVALFVLIPGSAGAVATDDTALVRADSLWQAEQRPAAFAVVDSLILHARADADTTVWIAGLTRRARFLKQDNRPAEAEAAVREALVLVQAVGDSALACAPRRWLGVALSAQGRNEEAAEQFRRLARLAEVVGDTTHAAWAAVGLGWDADLHQDHAAARERYGRAAALFSAIGDGEGELWAQLGEANAWFHLGRYEIASRGWGRVARLAGENGLARHEAITRNNIAGLQFVLGRPDISRDHYERAVAIWDSLGQQWERMPPVLNLGSCLAMLGQVDRARHLFQRELAACRSAGFTDYEARALRKLADLERDQGDFPAAAAHYREVLALGDDRPVLERFEVLLGLASLDVAGADHQGALTWLAAADSLLGADRTSQLRIRLDLARARSLMAVDRSEAAATLLDQVATQLGDAQGRYGLELELGRVDLHEARGDTTSALAALERAAEIWELERGLPLDPDWRAERSAGGRQVFVRLARYLAAADNVAEAFDRLQFAKARTLREQVRGPEADDPGAAAAAVVRLSDLQQGGLADGEVFIDVHLSPRGGVLFAVTADSCRMVDLPERLDLDRRLRTWRQLLGDPAATGAAIADSAASLHADLLAPVAHLIRASERVILSPDGDLNLVPVSELGPYGDRSWALVPSASLWHDSQVSGEEVPTAATAPGETSVIVLLPATHSHLTLPGATWQAEHLTTEYRDVVVQTGVVDPDLLSDLAGRILHVGAHVRADPTNAWQSAVLLDDGPEGELRAESVAAMRLRASLVVLASCSSGRGRVLAGEGVQGLAHAFLIAGARTVIASLWPVDDDLTALFMSRFYEHLAAGETAGQALASTRTLMRTDPATAHPFAWAGFVLLGDDGVVVSLETAAPARSWRRFGWLAMPAALALALVALRRWRPA